MRSSRSGMVDAKGRLATRLGDGQDDGPGNEPGSKDAGLDRPTVEAGTEAGEREGDGTRVRTTFPGGPENGVSPILESPKGFIAQPDSTCSFDLNEGHIHCTPALTS